MIDLLCILPLVCGKSSVLILFLLAPFLGGNELIENVQTNLPEDSVIVDSSDGQFTKH